MAISSGAGDFSIAIPSDPAIFIQKRSGPGYTLNFANFISWALTILLLGDIGFLVFFDLFHKVW
jgi:uncharacterized membrane protein